MELDMGGEDSTAWFQTAGKGIDDRVLGMGFA